MAAPSAALRLMPVQAKVEVVARVSAPITVATPMRQIMGKFDTRSPGMRYYPNQAGQLAKAIPLSSDAKDKRERPKADGQRSY